MSIDDDQQRLDALRREAAQIRRERLDRTRAASRITTVEAAADAADRDADALTSPEVEMLRTDVEHLTARLRTAWAHVDRQRLTLARYEAAGIDVDRVSHADQLRRVHTEEAQIRDAARAAFNAAGLAIEVPTPVTVEVPPSPNRDEVVALLDEVAQEHKARQVRRGRTTTHREPDRGAR